MAVQAEREGRQANGGDYLKLDIGMRRKAKGLPLDKGPEARAGDVWKQTGQSEDAQHHAAPRMARSSAVAAPDNDNAVSTISARLAPNR